MEFRRYRYRIHPLASNVYNRFITNLRFRVGFERKNVPPARYRIHLGRYRWALGALKTGGACVTLSFGRVCFIRKFSIFTNTRDIAASETICCSCYKNIYLHRHEKRGAGPLSAPPLIELGP